MIISCRLRVKGSDRPARKGRTVSSISIPENLSGASPIVTLREADVSALRDKYRLLQETMRSMDSVVVGFSGGPKSALLTKVAHDVLGVAAVAAIVLFSTQDRRERDDSLALGYAMGIPLVTIEAGENESGTPSEIFHHISQLAEKRGIHWIAYGDKHPESPEHGADLPNLWPRTPLAEIGLNDFDIAALSTALGLAAVESSTSPQASIGRFGAAEQFLQDLGFRRLILHEHDSLARLEADPSEIGRLIDPDIRSRINKKLKSLGYAFVAVDLDDATER